MTKCTTPVPNDNFTGFSSGMNTAARLQHQACRDEILVMEDAVRAVAGLPFRFGELALVLIERVERLGLERNGRGYVQNIQAAGSQTRRSFSRRQFGSFECIGG